MKKAKKDLRIDAVVLGCTELPLILTREDEDTVGVDIVDTTTIHALAAVEFSLKGSYT